MANGFVPFVTFYGHYTNGFLSTDLKGFFVLVIEFCHMWLWLLLLLLLLLLLWVIQLGRDLFAEIAKVFLFISDKKSFLLYLTRYTKNGLKYAKGWAIEIIYSCFLLYRQR